MEVFKNVIRITIGRPFVILFTGFFMLVSSIIDYYNPIPAILIGFGSAGEENILDGIIYLFQLLTAPQILTKVLIFLIGLMVIASLVMGLFFSGYFNIINNALDRKQKFRGEFFLGVRGFFSRTTFISFITLFLGFALVVFMTVASFPAIFVIKAFLAGKHELLAAAVIISLLTLGVIFFSFMFFRVYMFFWYPAVVNCKKGTFVTSKRIVDAHFWKITGRFIIFDLIFLAFLSVSYLSVGYGLNTPQGLIGILGGWIFKTLFFIFYVAYIFTAFKKYGSTQK